MYIVLKLSSVTLTFERMTSMSSVPSVPASSGVFATWAMPPLVLWIVAINLSKLRVFFVNMHVKLLSRSIFSPKCSKYRSVTAGSARTPWQHSPRLAVFKGSTSKGKGGEGKRGRKTRVPSFRNPKYATAC